MADSIQFKRGKRKTLPKLPDGTPGWCGDTGELFVGSPTGNRKVGEDIQAALEEVKKSVTELESQKASVTALEEVTKSVTELENQNAAVSSLAELDAQAALTDVIAAYNNLLACFRAAGEG